MIIPEENKKDIPEGHLGLDVLHLHRDVAAMDHRPRPGRSPEGKVQRVLTNHSYRRHTAANSSGAIVVIGKTHVWLEQIAGDEAFRKLAKQPDRFSASQRPGGFVLQAFPDETVSEVESLGVLNDLILVAHDAEDAAIARPCIGLIAFDLLAVLVIDRSPVNGPVELCEFDSGLGISSSIYGGANPVPRLSS